MSSDWAWLYGATRVMADRIDTVGVDALSAYMEQREQVIARLQEQGAVPTAETRSFFDLEAFNAWDRVILAKLISLSNEANDELTKLSARKMMKSGYERHADTTSFFFDTKK